MFWSADGFYCDGCVRTIEKLIENADQQMYLNKKRNREKRLAKAH